MCAILLHTEFSYRGYGRQAFRTKFGLVFWGFFYLKLSFFLLHRGNIQKTQFAGKTYRWVGCSFSLILHRVWMITKLCSAMLLPNG